MHEFVQIVVVDSMNVLLHDSFSFDLDVTRLLQNLGVVSLQRSSLSLIDTVELLFS